MASIDTFRNDVRDWLKSNCPESQRQPIIKDQQIWAGRNRSFYCNDSKIWFERMRDKGWTAPTWPTEYGGGGLAPDQAKILEQEMKALGCRPALYDIGLWMFGPALLEYGTEEQKQEHIPKIVREQFLGYAPVFVPLCRTPTGQGQTSKDQYHRVQDDSLGLSFLAQVFLLDQEPGHHHHIRLAR